MKQTMTTMGPQIWNGRYQRIPGDSTAFHVRRDGPEWQAYALWQRGDERAECPFLATDANYELAEAVVDGKFFLSGEKTGGSFLINEFGDVLVPKPSGYEVATVGRMRGSLPLVNSFSGELIDLAAPPNCRAGDPLERPYVGIQHNLSHGNELCFWDNGSESQVKMTPVVQDEELIARIRRVRPRGVVRFIVMYGGLIATKVPTGAAADPEWHAHYVGRLDFDKWFEEGM